MADSEYSKVELVIENGKEAEISKEGSEDVVDPWNVISTSATGVDYDKLIS